MLILGLQRTMLKDNLFATALSMRPGQANMYNERKE